MSQKLWQSDALLAAIQSHSSPETEIVAGNAISHNLAGVSIDSRTLEKDEIFFAIIGDQFDGHAFVDKALEKGAGAAIVKHGFSCEKHTNKLIHVHDPLEAMNALGRASRARLKGKMAGITGSVGKTGSKEMLRLCLGNQGKVHASEKSFNNHWGVPLSLSLMPSDTDFGIAEIGMNHSGEIIPLTAMVRPHVTLVTTVEPVHLGHFTSVEEIALAKAEIFTGLETGGTAILNRDNQWFDLLSRKAGENGARIISFGTASNADICMEEFLPSVSSSRIKARFEGQLLEYQIGMPGQHIAMNSLGVLAMVHALGADIIQASQNLKQLLPPQGRGQVFKIYQDDDKYFQVIDESYNANPASMRAAITTFGQTKKNKHGRRIAVLGDMLELGPSSKMLHIELANVLEESKIDLVFTSGQDMQALHNALPATRRGKWAASSKELVPEIVKTIQKDDAIMVKGSLGSKMGLIVEALRSLANDQTV